MIDEQLEAELDGLGWLPSEYNEAESKHMAVTWLPSDKIPSHLLQEMRARGRFDGKRASYYLSKKMTLTRYPRDEE